MGISQERLGLLAGIDESTASARMNQYEREIHHPSYSLVKSFALVLDVPTCWFYADDEELADLILEFHKEKKANLLK